MENNTDLPKDFSLKVAPEKIFSLNLEINLRLLAALQTMTGQLTMITTALQPSLDMNPNAAKIVEQKQGSIEELRQKIYHELVADIYSRYGT